MEPPPLLVIGNPTIDRNVVFGRSTGLRLGGTGAIAALALARFGNRVLMVGRCGPDLGALLDPVRRAGVEVAALPAPATLRFENTYLDPPEPERRVQRAEALPPAIGPADLAPHLSRRYGGILLGPLTPGDISLEAVRAVRASGVPVALDVQGFLRRVERDGSVRPRPFPDAAEHLEGLSLLHAGDEEAAALLGEPAADRESARRLARRWRIDTVAVTRGGDGAWIWSGREGLHDVPAFRPGARVADPTGCGDIFLAALLHGLLRGWSAARTGRFASMAAALNAFSADLRCATVEEVEEALTAIGSSADRL